MVSNSVANVTTTSSGTKFPTALVLETIEENETVYYLIPKHLAKKGRLKKKGTKLHVCQDHMFVAKHIKRCVSHLKKVLKKWKKLKKEKSKKSLKKRGITI